MDRLKSINKKLPPLNSVKHTDIVMNQIVKNINNETCFLKPSGERSSLIFDTKLTYSYQEVLDLLAKMDKLWEEGCLSGGGNPTYFS